MTTLPLPREPENWENHRACRDADPDLFFPSDKENGGQKARALYAQVRDAYCRRCPVQRWCLVRALRGEQHAARYGLLGGLTPHERADKATVLAALEGRLPKSHVKADAG